MECAIMSQIQRGLSTVALRWERLIAEVTKNKLWRFELALRAKLEENPILKTFYDTTMTAVQK